MNGATASGSAVTEGDVWASILPARGVSATMATGARDLQGASNIGRNNPAMWYAKLGYEAKIFDAGTTNIFVDYQNTEDLGAKGDDATYWGFQIVQILKDYATELFVAFSVADLDDSTATTDDDLTTGLFGARLKF